MTSVAAAVVIFAGLLILSPPANIIAQERAFVNYMMLHAEARPPKAGSENGHAKPPRERERGRKSDSAERANGRTARDEKKKNRGGYYDHPLWYQ